MVKNNTVVLVKPLAFSNQKRIKISGLTFVQTSKANPESYNVFDNNGDQIGYVCLMWGCVSCRCPNANGERIYESFFESEYIHEFEDDKLRQIFLEDVSNTLIKKLNRLGYVKYQQVECIKWFTKYGITFADKGDKWEILGKVDDDAWVIKGCDGAIQMIEEKKFKEHFETEIIIEESAVVICA